MSSPSRIETLRRFLQEDPHDPFTRFALATEYRKAGDLAQARIYFEKLVVDHPDYVGTYFHLGKLYEEIGRKADAVAMYERGIAVAGRLRDLHARAELQDALLKAQGIGFDD